MRRQGDGISRAFPKGPKQLPAQGNASLASLFSKLGVIDDLSMQRVEVTTTHALETRDPNGPDSGRIPSTASTRFDTRAPPSGASAASIDAPSDDPRDFSSVRSARSKSLTFTRGTPFGSVGSPREADEAFQNPWGAEKQLRAGAPQPDAGSVEGAASALTLDVGRTGELPAGLGGHPWLIVADDRARSRDADDASARSDVTPRSHGGAGTPRTRSRPPRAPDATLPSLSRRAAKPHEPTPIDVIKAESRAHRARASARKLASGGPGASPAISLLSSRSAPGSAEAAPLGDNLSRAELGRARLRAVKEIEGEMHSEGMEKWLNRRQLHLNQTFTTAQRRDLKRWFTSLDKDGSGEITIDELEGPLLATGIARNPDEVRAIFRAVDKDGSGEIGFKEFMQVISTDSSSGGGGGGGGGDASAAKAAAAAPPPPSDKPKRPRRTDARKAGGGRRPAREEKPPAPTHPFVKLQRMQASGSLEMESLLSIERRKKIMDAVVSYLPHINEMENIKRDEALARGAEDYARLRDIRAQRTELQRTIDEGSDMINAMQRVLGAVRASPAYADAAAHPSPVAAAFGRAFPTVPSSPDLDRRHTASSGAMSSDFGARDTPSSTRGGRRRSSSRANSALASSPISTSRRVTLPQDEWYAGSSLKGHAGLVS